MDKASKKTHTPAAVRTARLFRNGHNQAVRLPKEFEIQASEVLIRKHGSSLILTPKPQTWQDYFASAQSLADEFPEDIHDLPLETRDEL